MRAAAEIRPLDDSDVDAVVELALRAWEPVFASLRDVLGDAIFDRLHKPDWRTVQAEAVRESCTSGDRHAFVAVIDGRPVGFATVALDAFHERMGVVDIVGVDPDYQRHGIARQLMEHAVEFMRAEGMDIAAVGTGGDDGHSAARELYEALGYTPLPGVRYLKLL